MSDWNAAIEQFRKDIEADAFDQIKTMAAQPSRSIDETARRIAVLAVAHTALFLQRPAEQEGGWKLVPVEPTQEMLDKGESSLICGPEPQDIPDAPSMTWAHAHSCYRAMLAAAPPHKAAGER